MGYSLQRKKKSFVETCRHMPLSLPPPPWPQLFDQPPIPNRLPQSQFLSDLDRSSGKIYLPPLTNASVTCVAAPSKSTTERKVLRFCSSAPLSVLDLVSDKIYLPSLTNSLGTSGGCRGTKSKYWGVDQRVLAVVGVGESGMWWHVSTKDLFLYVENTP